MFLYISVLLVLPNTSPALFYHLLCPALLALSPSTPQDTSNDKTDQTVVQGIPTSQEHRQGSDEDTAVNPDKRHLFMA